jgi:hypothetical protein
MKTITYILDQFGTDKVTGLGLAGNLHLICQMILNNSNNNIHIDWFSRGKCIVYDKQYSEDTKILNPFEYYYDQKFTYSTIISNFHHPCKSLPYANCNLLNSDLYKLCKKKFYENFTLKHEFQDEVNNYYDTYFKNNSVLGIQVRLTDMEHYHNVHTIEYYINKTRNILNKKKIDCIFIASDTEVTINKFKSAFPTVKIYYQKNIMRSKKEKDAVQPQDRINTQNSIVNSRKYHNYLNGKEVLMDILLLSKCNYFLRSHSAVSDIVIIFSDNIKELCI